MALTVEFLGPPGAGKSTVAAALVGELTRSGLAADVVTQGTDSGTPPVRRLLTKTRHALTEAAMHPAASTRAVVSLASSGQVDPGALAHLALAWLVAQRLVARGRTASGIVVLDEGPLQALWSVGLAGTHDRMLGRWAARPEGWRVADVVVVLLPPVATLASRLAARLRPHGRVDRLRGSRRLEALRRGRDLAREIAMAGPALGVREDAVIWLGRADDGADEMARAVAARIALLSGDGSDGPRRASEWRRMASEESTA